MLSQKYITINFQTVKQGLLKGNMINFIKNEFEQFETKKTNKNHPRRIQHDSVQ
jgi:hypothetical protein